jgi:hypothetical protein
MENKKATGCRRNKQETNVARRMMAVLTGALLSIAVLAAASLAALAPAVVYRTRGAVQREAMQSVRTAQWERDRGAAAHDRRADYEAARAATPAHDTDVPPTSQGGVEQDMPGHEGPSHSQPTAPQDDGAEPPRPYPRPRPPTCDQEQPTGPFRSLFGYESSFVRSGFRRADRKCRISGTTRGGQNS